MLLQVESEISHGIYNEFLRESKRRKMEVEIKILALNLTFVGV